MSRDEREENVGEIAVRNDECFWIFPMRYIYNKKLDIYSPWFSYLGEKWRFVMCPNYYDYEMTQFYLWRKFRHGLPSNNYTLQLKLKTAFGEQIAFCENYSNCEYGFQANNFFKRDDIKKHQNEVIDCGQIKIFFVIKKCYTDDDPSVGTSDRENSEDHMQDEASSDEDNNDEKEGTEDKGIRRLLENFKQLFIGGIMSDVVLRVDSREFKVHKLVLVARSPVFASMFEYDTTENRDNAVDIPDCKAESFEVFLHYLYCGSTDSMSTSNVYNVYYAADKYQVDDLKEKCVNFMKTYLSVETFCDVIALSIRHRESKLKETAIDFFCPNLRKIIRTVQWQKYLIENPTQCNELLIKAVGN